MNLGLEGKTAIVTGGASHIGRAISIALAAERVNVAIADIDEQQMGKVITTIKNSGGMAIGIKTDVTRYSQVEAMVKSVLDQFGKIDILVNNAGWEEVHLFLETTPEFWDKIININYKAMLNCCRIVLPHMVEKKVGVVISIASDAGRTGEYMEAVYGGCKGGQIALSKTIAKEVGRYGIRVNAICPGLTPPNAGEIGEYSMHTKFPFNQEQLEKAARAYALRRLGKPQDIASAVVFLASDGASFVTGQTISVSGGYTMV